MRRMLSLVIFGLLALSSAVVYGQGDGIGGVLIRDVPIPNDDEEWPNILPAGGLVAFGSGNDWSASQRKQGKVLVHFVIREQDGGRDRGFVRIPEDAVHIFNWACGEPMDNPFSKRNPIICNPFVGKYASEEWQLRFVAEARKAAQGLGLKLVEEFSPAYQGGASAGVEAISPSAPASPPSKCTVDQVLKMKEAGLSDAQIKAACGG
jgi:hypothetical protein